MTIGAGVGAVKGTHTNGVVVKGATNGAVNRRSLTPSSLREGDGGHVQAYDATHV